MWRSRPSRTFNAPNSPALLAGNRRSPPHNWCGARTPVPPSPVALQRAPTRIHQIAQQTKRKPSPIVSRKLLSVFTGAGGLDLGFEAAGFETIGCVELDPVARSTLEMNRPRWPRLPPHDVCELGVSATPETLRVAPGTLDLLIGGPPCQPFSKAGQWAQNGRRGLQDQRADALSGVVELARRLSPRIILLENVPGFVTGKSSAMPWLAGQLGKPNKNGWSYALTWRVLDAADFGVPQHRKRAIVILTRNDLAPPEWPQPVTAEQPPTCWDALHDAPVDELPSPRGFYSGLLSSIPEGRNYQWHTAKGGGKPLFGYRTRYWSFLLKLAKDRPSWTVSAQPGPSTGPFHWDNRPLSVPELKRLQTFPDTWRFSGNPKEQRRQIGNATPCAFAELLARAMMVHLGGAVEGPPRYQVRPASSPVPPEAPLAPVSKEYLHLVGDHSPHAGTGRGPRPRMDR